MHKLKCFWCGFKAWICGCVGYGRFKYNNKLKNKIRNEINMFYHVLDCIGYESVEEELESYESLINTIYKMVEE